MRADTVSLIDKLAREHRLKKKEYLALLENASVEEHVHAAMLADKERRRPQSRPSRTSVQQALISVDFAISKQSKSRKTRVFRDFSISTAFVLLLKNLIEFDKV